MPATSIITESYSSSYTVELPVFQGPLDLLLNLIEQEELDITKISLAQVTNQYLAYLDILKETDPDELTDFLVIAARLILIKSEVLLPRPPLSMAQEEEEDIGDELARQLLLYKMFKEIARQLQEIQDKNQRNFVRLVPPPKIEPKLSPGEVSLEDLIQAARHIFAIKPPEPVVDEVVSPEVITIGQQMAYIWQEITTNMKVSLQRLMGQRSTRIEIIVTLLAVLELIKRQVIKVDQPHPFGNILIYRHENAPPLTEVDWEALTELNEVS